MRKTNSVFRGVALLALLAYAQALVVPGLVKADPPECAYNRANPTLENARLLFKITDYTCAEQELNDLLAKDSLDLQIKADAHVLLAAVYYAKLRDSEEQENRVIAEFVAAFKAFRDWRGELDIKSPEFKALMERAQAQVDKEVSKPVAEEPVAEPEKITQDTTAVMATEPTVEEKPPVVKTWGEPEKKSKPWYKKWWVLGLGVGVVATSVALAAGGGGDDGETAPPAELPGFPDHP